MPEIRIDPVTGRHTIFARERSGRPDEFRATSAARAAVACAFCVGHEGETPTPLAEYGAAGTVKSAGNWLVRVVPNKFPALTLAAPSEPAHHGLYTTLAGVGSHEVIIESPRHVASVSQLTDDECRLAFLAYRDRLQVAGAEPRHAAALVFKNVGPESGASLEHVHSQLLALPCVPTQVGEEIAGSSKYWQEHERCVYCAMLAQELADARRVVAQTARFVAYCPFASRTAYEVCILPRTHESRYEAAADDVLAELSWLMRDLVRRLETVLPHPAYNYLIHSAPFRVAVDASYHWHLELFPRLTKLAGFEWGTGFYINVVPPEEAAAQLRAAL